jgi:hypothetical protein
MADLENVQGKKKKENNNLQNVKLTQTGCQNISVSTTDRL